METKSTGFLTGGAWNATAALAVLSCVGAVGVMGGCRGERSERPPRQFLPDMDDSPKWKAQSKSEFFVDSRTMRSKVPGTVAFGEYSIAIERMPFSIVRICLSRSRYPT